MNKTLCDAAGVSFSPWESVDYREILEIYRSANEQGLLSEEFTLEFMDQKGKFALFLDVEMPSFFDNKAETHSFNSPDFIRYLEDTKAIPSSRPTTEIVSLTGGNLTEIFSESNIDANTSLMMRDTPLLESLIQLADIPDNCVGPLLLSSCSGKTAFFSDLAVVVPKSCRNPDLAWKFLKFCISPVNSPAYAQTYRPEGSVDIVYGSLPVASENFQKYGELYGKIALISSEMGLTPDDFDPASVEDPFPEGFFSQMDQVIARLDYTQNNADVLEKIYSSILKDYYDTDSLSAQECAQQIQERVEIWLNE